MALLSTNTSVGRFVAERPGRAGVFEVFGIDYCCEGDESLGDVCVREQLDVREVLRSIELCDADVGSEAPADWSRSTMSELVEHILWVHHGYLYEMLPRLKSLLDKVADRHGGRRPELLELKTRFGSLKLDLEAHMLKEEEVLFPMCRELEDARIRPDFHCRTVKSPIGVMVREHDEFEKEFAIMRELTGGFEPPPDACNTCRVMLDGLAELEADVRLHVYEENDVLFPRASAVEAALPLGSAWWKR